MIAMPKMPIGNLLSFLFTTCIVDAMAIELPTMVNTIPTSHPIGNGGIVYSLLIIIPVETNIPRRPTEVRTSDNIIETVLIYL
jgi:hypothetical protein